MMNPIVEETVHSTDSHLYEGSFLLGPPILPTELEGRDRPAGGSPSGEAGPSRILASTRKEDVLTYRSLRVVRTTISKGFPRLAPAVARAAQSRFYRAQQTSVGRIHGGDHVHPFSTFRSAPPPHLVLPWSTVVLPRPLDATQDTLILASPFAWIYPFNALDVHPEARYPKPSVVGCHTPDQSRWRHSFLIILLIPLRVPRFAFIRVPQTYLKKGGATSPSAPEQCHSPIPTFTFSG